MLFRSVFHKEAKTVDVSKVAANNTSEWVNGYLFFDEELLPDIAKELERSYAVKITISDPKLNSFRFYGNFERTQLTIEEVMNLLCSTDKLEYTVFEKEYILKAK